MLLVPSSHRSFQTIGDLDIEAALVALDDESMSTDAVKDLFQRFSDQANASATRVASLPAADVSLVELQTSKKRLQARLCHLRAVTRIFSDNK